MYQKCPICDGIGLVSRPPWVAGDQDSWICSGSGPYTCKTCGGNGVIWYNEKLLDPCGLLDLVPMPNANELNFVIDDLQINNQ